VKSLELVIVQFDEVKRLIEVERIPQFRLAHILLDSAVELIMHRMVNGELKLERYSFDQLENLRRLERGRKSDNPFNRRFAAAGPSDDELRREIQRLEGSVTSKNKRKKIDHNFGDKIDFLVERKKLPKEIGPILKKLHDYRNETYHRDRHRIEIIRPAVLIYFDTACTVLDHYDPGMLIGSDALGPEFARFQDDVLDRADLFELHHRAAKQLRREIGLDLAVVRSALVSHLLERLYDLESGLEYIEASSVNGAAPGDGIRWMQIEDDELEAIFKEDVLRSRKYPLTNQKRN
jgi:hypothetical protein